MGAFDIDFDFSDDQDVAAGSPSATSTVIGTNHQYNAVAPTDTWLVACDHELGGGLEFTVMVSDQAMAGSGLVTAALVTKNANASFSAGATVVASVEFPAASVVQTVKSVKLPAGTKLQAYTGVLYTVTGAAITAGHFSAHLGPAPVGN